MVKEPYHSWLIDTDSDGEHLKPSINENHQSVELLFKDNRSYGFEMGVIEHEQCQTANLPNSLWTMVI